MKNLNSEFSIILFDGDCSFCNASIQFIYKNDKHKYFKFTSLQSKFGQNILKQFGLETNNFDTFVLYQNHKIFTKSSAAFKILNKLSTFLRIFYFFIIIPIPIRDFFYDFIAKNRHKIFKKKVNCKLPDNDFLERIIK